MTSPKPKIINGMFWKIFIPIFVTFTFSAAGYYVHAENQEMMSNHLEYENKKFLSQNDFNNWAKWKYKTDQERQGKWENEIGGILKEIKQDIKKHREEDSN